MPMPLSDYERRVLDEIESDLAAENVARRSARRRFALTGLGLLVTAAALAGVVLGATVLSSAVGIASAFVVGAVLGAGLPPFWRRCIRRPAPEKRHAHE